AVARSDTRASRDSKYSAQSSNVPPSLFGSDRSTFSTPLLGPLPHVSVPSDIASLRTAAASQTLPRESAHAPEPEPPAPVRVQHAVASPVSIGGRKKQSLVIDARSASDEVLQETQSVKSATPSIVHTSSSSSSTPSNASSERPSARTRTQDVLASPAMPTTAILSAEERRAWARQNPQQRPPLALSEESSEASEDLHDWDARLRRRAEEPPRPEVTESPAYALQSKSYGGLHPHEPQREQRKEHIHGALASLERKSPRPRKTRQNRDPVHSPSLSSSDVLSAKSKASSTNSPKSLPQPPISEPPMSEPEGLSGDSGFSSEDPSPEASPALSSRPPFRMGRHGSSPLNPNTASGSTAPPMPPPPGLIKRLTGTMRRKRDSDNPPQTAQTPLPRRWWRNIKESMYAPIPPIHVEHSPQLRWPLTSTSAHAAAAGAVGAGHEAGLEPTEYQAHVAELPAQPFRRHSFSGSTDIEEQRITAALSPRENMRRKVTLAERVRGVLRGRRQHEQPAYGNAALVATAAGAAIAGAGSGAAPIAHPDADYSLKLAQSISSRPDVPQWSTNNPFVPSGPRPMRRASFDTLSVHEMAEVDRAEMHSRLNNLVSSHSSAAPAKGEASHQQLAASPMLNPASSLFTASSSSNFTFQAPSTPKPLPATPGRRASTEQVFTFPSAEEMKLNQQKQSAPSPVFKTQQGADYKGKAPEYLHAGGGSPQAIAAGTSSAMVPEMSQRPSSLVEKPPVAAGPYNVDVNTATQIPQVSDAQMTGQTTEPPAVALGPPVRKRPSLLKRLTAGWRNPASTLDPIPEESQHYQQQQQQQQQQKPSAGEAAASALAMGTVGAAASGILGRLFGSAKASGARKSAEFPEQAMSGSRPTVPNVAVVHSPPASTADSHSVDPYGAGPQPYPTTAAEHSQAYMAGQPAQHYSSGSVHPQGMAPHGNNVLSSTVVSPNNQQQQQPQYGSMYPGGRQTPLPGQGPPPLDIQSQSFQQNPVFASLPQNQQGPPYPGPMSAPPHQGRPHGMVQNAQPPPTASSQYPGASPYGYPPSTPVGAVPPAQPTSKLMSAMASIPLLGSLFSKKQKPVANSVSIRPSNRYDGKHRPPSTYYTRPTSGMSGYTTYSSHGYTEPPGHGIGPQNILEKIKGAGRWYFVPLVGLLMRESAAREIMPLVGRYAMRYPLVEAEERAVLGAAARAKKGIVHAGGMRAVDAKEFRHAAPALRTNRLDGRLDNVFVPQFSRLRKYRRAPEVWDDSEAHDIAQRVQSRMRPNAQFTRGRRAGEPALRGGGGGGRDREPMLGPVDDYNCSSRGLSVDGPEGSGERLVPAAGAHGGPSSLPLAYRLGDFVSNMFKRKNPEIRQQSPASYLDHTAEGSRPHASLISPRARGMSRIEDKEDSAHVQVNVREGDVDDDGGDAESVLRSLRREPSAELGRDKPSAEEMKGKRNGFWKWFFGRGPGDADSARPGDDLPEPYPVEPDRAELDPAALPEAGVLNTALHRSPAQSSDHKAKARDEPADSTAAKTPSANYPPMFPPFSHLPPRLVDQLMHRVGEPRVFIGSASSQLVEPTNSAEAGDEIFSDASPYRTGTEWGFLESVKFSSPYPTTTRAVRNRKVWSRQRRRLLLKPRNNEIARWPLHLEVLRDFMQMLALVLGVCGFTKAREDSSVGDRWPWMVVSGVPETLGLLWADLSTTTGKSIGFFAFFGGLAAIALSMWVYGLYLESPTRSAKDKGKSEKEEEEGLITYEEELVVVPGPFNLIGRLFSKITRRQRMHAVYVVLTTLYVPVVKLCLEAIVWSQGYWPVPNPYRSSDHPDFGAAADGMRDPQSFCYTTTMRSGKFNGAFVVLPLAVLLFLALGVVLPLQVHRLAEGHKPRVPGWADGKVPGFLLPPKDSVSMANLTSSAANNNSGSRPGGGGGGSVPVEGASALPPGTSVPRGAPQAPADAGTRDIPPSKARDITQTRDASETRTRDDPNPMMYAEPIWQGIQQLNLVNPEMLGYLSAIYGLMYGANAGGPMGGNNNLGGLFTNAWKHIQQWWTKETEEDPYLGMEKDEAYQARLRDMKHSQRNRHLATVQYRRALDTDAGDFRFLYVGQYPAHAGDPARLLLWKLLAVFVAVVLQKDNCWARSHARQAMDAARGAMLLLVALLMLRSVHSHRPFFDPTANLAAVLARLATVCAAVFALPLFLMADPLSQAHMGLCITVAVANLLAVLALLWLLSGALPGVQMVVRGTAATLTFSPGILIARSAYDPRLRRLLIERVWQDTWSAILLASRDFRLLPGHRVTFNVTTTHPPYMLNYIGFAAERHLENLHLYEKIGRRAYCKAILMERDSDQRTGLMDEIARVFTGPDMYFNPFAGSASPDVVATRYRLAQSEVQSWFGSVHILHFPFMVCIVYDDLPNVVVPIEDENDLVLYLQQNQDPAVVARRDVRRRLRALNGQHVTMTYIEHSGADGAHVRYCLPQYAAENEQYLAQFAGRRRILYRGVFSIKQHKDDYVAG
ncbi:hypothetical protein GGF43_002109, partial [Coemansia sp. RSA 2618]